MVLGIAAVIGLKEVSAGTVLREGWKGYALWFVPVLFLALLLAKAIMVYIKRAWVRYALCGVLLITGVALSYYKLYLPWALSTVPYATCLVLLGTSLRKFQAYIQKPLWWLFPACLALTFAISYKWRLDLAWNQITPVVLLTLGALAGSVMVFTLSAWLTRSKWITAVLQAIGKETFIIMAFSQIFYLMACHYLPGHKLACYGIMVLLLLSVALIKNGLKRIF